MSTADLANLVSRLEAVVQKIEHKSGGGGSGVEASVQFIEDYDAFVEEYVTPYLNASSAIGDVVDEQAKLLKSVCDEQRKFLVVVSRFSAPKDAAVFSKLAAPMSELMGKMEALKNKLDRKSNLVNHVRAASEGILTFGWIGVPKTPMKYIKDTKDTVMFYTNKILTEFKASEQSDQHKAWVAAYVKFFDGLRDYIKEHHTTGPSWNAGGPSASPEAVTSGGPPPPPAAPAAPPPPPPGAVAPAPTPAPAAASVNALLQDINKGADVTKGLKKVTNDMKTHKNPELRKHHVPVPYKAKPTAYKPMGKPKPAQAPAKPPKFELQDNKKWIVEHQDKATLSIDDCSMKHTVYVYKCNGCTISVTKKVNSIVLDSCKKTGIVFSSVVSGVEIINCQSVQAQAQGQMHSVSIDKTDGCIVFLSKECMDVNIVTAKSSEMNISVPKEDGDFEEFPIVEQFRTLWDEDKKTFVTVASEQLG